MSDARMAAFSTGPTATQPTPSICFRPMNPCEPSTLIIADTCCLAHCDGQCGVSLTASIVCVRFCGPLLACYMYIISSSAIAERPRCRVGEFWPKVEDDILQTV